MPRTPCSHPTAAGRPCRAPAIPGTEPPACAAHGGRPGGAPPGNQNALRTGLYKPGLTPFELADLVAVAGDRTLDDEIACARVTLRRILVALNQPDTMSRETFVQAAGMALHATRTIARLLREQRALSGEAADNFNSALGQILDELSTLLGVDL